LAGGNHPDRVVEDLGDLVGAEVVVVWKDEDFALVLGKALDGVPDLNHLRVYLDGVVLGRFCEPHRSRT